jgi:hypothetical protein
MIGRETVAAQRRSSPAPFASSSLPVRERKKTACGIRSRADDAAAVIVSAEAIRW